MAFTEAVACNFGMREALRRATRERHSAVARVHSMRRLFADDYTVDEYRLHVVRLFGFFEPIERLISRVSAPGLEQHGFERAPALAQDLAAMGYCAQDIGALDRCATLPDVNATNVYGCSYVLLGSLLGGRIIAERLRHVLGTHVSLSFYGGGSAAIDERWASFCAELELATNGDIAAICDTASATFDAYAAWFGEDPKAARAAGG